MSRSVFDFIVSKGGTQALLFFLFFCYFLRMSFEFSKGKMPDGNTVTELSEVEEQNLHSILRASVDRFLGDSQLELRATEEMVVDVFPEARGDSDDTARFLSSLDPKEIEWRAYEEAKNGNDALLLALLAVSIADQELFLGIEDLRLAKDQTPHEYILKKFTGIREIFEVLAQGSKRFAKEYRTEDYIKMLKSVLSRYEHARAKGPLSEGLEKEMAVLKRIVAHKSLEGDGDIFYDILKKEIVDLGNVLSIFLPNTLRSIGERDDTVESNLKAFLIRFHLLEHIEESGIFD